MNRPTIDDITERCLTAMGDDERAEYEESRQAVELAFRIGESIRELRLAADMSQRALARRMGTSQAQVARVEAGMVAATLSTLQRVATALDVALTVEFAERPSLRAPA
ncbi:MAG: helix-turn-helix transcriptional regulator [Acidimicrobiaceae bacterium]|nr:helix-turn-helix transcriptional regulator [Acidimicrobiaceae bacterium]